MRITYDLGSSVNTVDEEACLVNILCSLTFEDLLLTVMSGSTHKIPSVCRTKDDERRRMTLLRLCLARGAYGEASVTQALSRYLFGCSASANSERVEKWGGSLPPGRAKLRMRVCVYEQDVE